MESNDYYTGQCKNCQKDCDGDYCSYKCRDEWESGKADYDSERMKDSALDEQWGPL